MSNNFLSRFAPRLARSSQLMNLITVVDTTTFLDHIARTALVNEEDTPDLFYRSEDERQEKEEMESEWMEELPQGLREALSAGRNKYVSKGTSSVSQLCMSQVEISDVVLLNKIDLQTEKEVVLVEKVVKSLNPRARVIKCERGDIDIRELLQGPAEGTG